MNLEKPQNLMNPQTKEGQGLDYWAKSLLDQGLINEEAYKEFIYKNNHKEETMAQYGLPQLKHYGFFNSLEQIKEKIKPKEDERFIIRCVAKNGQEVKRLIDGSFDEICDFAEKLEGGFSNWNVELKEFAKTKAAGTIIVDSSGRTTMETWHGAHYLNTGNTPKYTAEFDPENFDQHFKWQIPESAKDGEEMQQYALKALRYIFPHLKPKTDSQIYIEYGVKENGGVYFLDANDSSLLTERRVKKD